MPDECLQGTNLRIICSYSMHSNPNNGVNTGSVMVISLYVHGEFVINSVDGCVSIRLDYSYLSSMAGGS